MLINTCELFVVDGVSLTDRSKAIFIFNSSFRRRRSSSSAYN